MIVHADDVRHSHYKAPAFELFSSYVKLFYPILLLYNVNNSFMNEVKSLTDKDAINQIRAGSQEALSWLIDKYGGYVSTIVWNIIGRKLSLADVEEISSDVFFALWTQSDHIRTTSLRGYLAGIARNMAKNKLRDAGHELDLDENLICVNITNMEESYARKEIQKIVRQTVNDMSEPEREILLRYYFYYQTMDAISKEMGINLSTVKTKLRRSKELLRQILINKLE